MLYNIMLKTYLLYPLCAFITIVMFYLGRRKLVLILANAIYFDNLLSQNKYVATWA